MQSIVISIINYNGLQNTLDCLASLDSIDQSGISVHVLVVDNHSEENFSIPVDVYKNISLEIIRSDTNLGFSAGHNIAIKKALKQHIDYVVLLNNDTLVDKRFLQEMLSVFTSHKNGGAVSPKVYFAKGHEYHKERYKDKDEGHVIWYAGGMMDWNNVIGKHRGVDEVDYGQFETIEQTDFATGCCMMIPTAVLQKIGLLPTEYFLYYEDTDISWRIQQLGYAVFFAPKAKVWHKNAGSTGGSGSLLQDYYITRNRMVFGMRYAPFRTKLALFRESIRLLTSGRPNQKRGIQDYYRGRLGKARYMFTS